VAVGAGAAVRLKGLTTRDELADHVIGRRREPSRVTPEIEHHS